MEAVGRLAGGIAHDFNNILTAINGYSDLLMRQVEAQSARAKVREIRLAADRATSLTKQLLAFSRKQILQPKILNLNTVVSEVYSMLQPVIGEHIELVLSLSPSLASVMVDPGQLSQVILNLAVNARDAMPDGGTLTVETRNIRLDEEFCRSHSPVEPGDYVKLSITDTGIGMDAATQNRVFEPFFTTKERGKGTGLGLSTVYGIVKQSGGYIRLESAVNKGTSFKIYLPTVQDQEKHAPAECEEPVPLSTGKGTILLVEDEEVVRSLGREVLELCGYKVLEASNGAQALRASVEHVGRIDLLLTDVVMPGMSGVDLAEKLSKDIPNLKILYTSGYADGAPLSRLNWNDHEQFLQKPFTPELLALKVGEVMAT
jgi:CheY-like chemotaxis protein